MQVVIYGGIVLLILLMMGKSDAAEIPKEPERPPLPPAPAPPGRSVPGAPGTPAGVRAPSGTRASVPVSVSPVGPPQTTPTGAGISAAEVEKTRLLIAEAFQRGLQKRRDRLAAAGKKETEQATVNATAAFFRQQGIPLEKPNLASLPTFYKLGAKAAADKLARTLNLWMPTTAPVAKTTPGTVTAKAPTVTTTPDPKKVSAVREGYARAMAYAIDAAKQRSGKTLTADNVLVPVSQYFSFFGIPHPNALTAANLFWANPLSTIQSKVAQAVKYTEQQVDIQIPPRTPTS